MQQYLMVEAGMGRSAGAQALHQLLAQVVLLALATSGGAAIGKKNQCDFKIAIVDINT